MITRDELRAIVARHEADLRDDCQGIQCQIGRGGECHVCGKNWRIDESALHRGALLDLLRKVASYDSRLECEGRVICILCGAEGGCDSDCPAPVLEVLRGG